MNSRSGPSAFSLARVTISRPFSQVVITVKATTPMSSGSHAPCTSLVTFAARNIRSTSRSKPPPVKTTHSGHFHRVRA
jgi:hypothetical protein